MKMKKIWLVLFALSLLLTAAACGDDNAVESKTEKEAYKIVKTDTEPDWTNVPVLPIDNVLWTEDYGIRAQGQLNANFYKCGNKTPHKHYLSWAPIDLDSPNFHCPEYFGVIQFEE